MPFRDLLPMVHPNDIVFDGRWDTGGPLQWWGGTTLSGWVTPCPPGWDISSLNLAEAMRRAEVLDWSLQEQLWPHMEKMKPRPSIFIPEFIAANQEERADNVLHGSMAEQVLVGWRRRGEAGDAGRCRCSDVPPLAVSQVEQIRRDIRDFRESSGVDKVIVLWTANTERFCDVVPGLNDTADNLLRAIEVRGHWRGPGGWVTPPLRRC